MLSPEEHLAKTSASDTLPVLATRGTVWMENVLASPFLSSGLWNDTNQNGLFGRMFRMSWRHGIPVDFSALPQTLPNSGIMSPGECWISDGLGRVTSPAHVFSWSEIVTQDAPQRYYLSQKALAGIAKRDRKPRLFSQQEGAWLSTTERHAFWMNAAQE
jgi:hypothetical protein